MTLGKPANQGEPRVWVSTAGFKSLESLDRVLEVLADSGFLDVELSGGHPPETASILPKLKRWQDEVGFSFIVHNYFPVPEQSFLLNIAALDHDEWKRSIAFCQTALELAAELESPVYAVHPGYIGSLRNRGDDYFFPISTDSRLCWARDIEDAYGRLLAAVQTLAPVAARLGVRFAVENLFPLPELPPQLMVSVNDWRRFVSDTSGTGVGILLDLAHLKIARQMGEADVDEALSWILGDGRPHLAQIHLSDNDGTFDDHEPLQAESSVLKLIQDWGSRRGWPKVPITYESRGLTADHLRAVVPRIRRAFARLRAGGSAR